MVISEEMNDIKEQIRTDMHNMIMKMKESLLRAFHRNTFQMMWGKTKHIHKKHRERQRHNTDGTSNPETTSKVMDTN